MRDPDARIDPGVHLLICLQVGHLLDAPYSGYDGTYVYCGRCGVRLRVILEVAASDDTGPGDGGVGGALP